MLKRNYGTHGKFKEFRVFRYFRVFRSSLFLSGLLTVGLLLFPIHPNDNRPNCDSVSTAI
jgi:hypothetical protein